MSVASSRTPRSRWRAQNGHPMVHAVGAGPGRLGWHRMIPAQRDRDVLRVDEDVEEMLR